MAIPLWNPRTGNETMSRADLHVHSVYSDGLKTVSYTHLTLPTILRV